MRPENDETHDFAMAILEREITFTDSVRPICIPRQVRMLEATYAGLRNTKIKNTKLQDMEFGGMKAIAAGWGRYYLKALSPFLS